MGAGGVSNNVAPAPPLMLHGGIPKKVIGCSLEIPQALQPLVSPSLQFRMKPSWLKWGPSFPLAWEGALWVQRISNWTEG